MPGADGVGEPGIEERCRKIFDAPRKQPEHRGSFDDGVVHGPIVPDRFGVEPRGIEPLTSSMPWASVPLAVTPEGPPSGDGTVVGCQRWRRDDRRVGCRAVKVDVGVDAGSSSLRAEIAVEDEFVGGGPRPLPLGGARRPGDCRRRTRRRLAHRDDRSSSSGRSRTATAWPRTPRLRQSPLRWRKQRGLEPDPRTCRHRDRPRRVKNDLADATMLADLLRTGRLPEASVGPPTVRELREEVRYGNKRTRLRAPLHVDAAFGDDRHAADGCRLSARHRADTWEGALGKPGRRPATR